MNVGRLANEHSNLTPLAPALFFEGRSLDYDDLDAQVAEYAAGLQALGVEKGDRVVLVLPNLPEFVSAYLGTLRLGAVVVSANPRLTVHEVRFLVRDSGARAVVTLSELASTLALHEGPEAPWVVCIDDGWPSRALSPCRSMVDVDPRDPAAIVYTSGTTGRPKGATLTHENVVFNALAKRDCLGIRPADRLLLFLPLFHCFGQNAVMNAALHSGASIVLHRHFDIQAVLRSIVEDGVTVVFGVPPVFGMFLEAAGADAFPDVRLFFSAAAPLPASLEERWQAKFGRPIHQGYGLTETSPFASYNHIRRHRPGSVGTPIDGVAMKVVSLETGEDLPPGQVGEIAIKGPNVMLGYWGRPEETRAAIRDGWFHTGDVGLRDEDGYYHLVDRLRDMINVGGWKAYPAEIEDVLCRHPAVAGAAVFGVRDEVLGELVAARVVPRDQRSPAVGELLEFCRRSLALHKVPDHIEVSDSLPRGPTGKVLKRVLREEFAARAASEPPAPGCPASATGREAIRGWLLLWLNDGTHGAAGRDVTDEDRPFADYGLSSLGVLAMMRGLSEFVGRTLSASLPWVYPTVDRLAARVAEISDPGPASGPTGLRSPAEPEPFPAEDHTTEDLRRLLAVEIERSRQYLDQATKSTREGHGDS